MSIADDTETPHPRPPSEGELGSKLRREQVHSALFGSSGPEASTRVNRFMLIELIGAGGMGELYAAYDAQLDRKIALKLVRSGRGGGQADARLQREAQALAKLSHPNVVTVYEVGSEGDRVFVAMEYVHGRTLTAWLEEVADRPEPERVHELLLRFRDAGRGLAAVHAAGLAHRDFKPDNVVVGNDGRVRVVDFGLARSTVEATDERAVTGAEDAQFGESLAQVDSRSDALTPELEFGTLTATGTVLGTPRYMAPEQWRARRGDSRSDQFSFCVALLRALYGAWPFEGTATPALRVAVVGGELREPARKPEVPARLHAALLRGLATDPERRWPDMSELLAAIDDTLAPRRRRVGAWLLAAGLTTGLAISAALIFVEREPPASFTLEPQIAGFERELSAERRRSQAADDVARFDASGDSRRADLAFETFAELPQYAHTHALARAWLDQAARLRARGDAKGELAALGEAQLASPIASQRRYALFELARALARDHRYPQLGATLAALADEGEPSSAELLGMQVREAVSRRDFAVALERLAVPEAAPLAAELLPIVSELQRVTRTEHSVPHVHVRLSAIAMPPSLDLDGDRRPDLILASRAGPVQVIGARADLPVLQPSLELPVVEGRTPAFRPVAIAAGRLGAPDWLIGDVENTRTLFELVRGPEGVRATAVAFPARGVQWVLGDLFAGPGWDGWEGFGASTIERRMHGLRRGPEGLERFTPDPSLAALGSDVEELAIADLDGNGDDELIAGVGAWWAYDVRVLAPDRARPGRFELAARRKLGAISGLISFPAPTGAGQWVAVSMPTMRPNSRVFPADQADGVPSGVSLLAWPGPGRALEVVDQIALPDNFRPGASDIDGDGRSELVVQLDAAIALLYPGADDRHAVLWLDGLVYQAIVDLDGDGDDELIVADAETGAVMVMGTGDDRMPILVRDAAEASEPPPALDPALHEMWIRAEALAMIGLFDQARSAYTELALLASASEAALAHRRSAELADRSGARRQAARLYERADDLDSLARASTRYQAIHAFAEAARVAERLADRSGADPLERERWRARAALQRRRAEPAHALEFEFDEPLDEGWRIARAGLLRREPTGLRVESLGSSEPVLLRRTIVWEGDRLALELDLDLVRMEWASELRVTLVPVDEQGQASGDPIAELAIGSRGGGDRYRLDVSTDWRLEPDSVGASRTMQGALPPLGQHRFRLRVDLLADDDRTWSTITTLDGTGPRDTAIEFERPAWRDAMRPGRYELRISSGTEPWVRGVVRLERLRIDGARDDLEAAPATRRERVLLSLAQGEHERALAELDASEPGELASRDADWLRGLAFEQLGRWSEALPLLEHALGDCRDREALARFAQGLLIQPDRVGPSLRRVCSPERFLLATWEVARITLYQHKDLADLHRTLTTQLVDLDRFEAADFEQAKAILGLLTSRARGWRMQELASAAEADLRRVIELSSRWSEHPSSETLTVEQRDEIERTRSIAHIELALVLMGRDQHGQAAIELARALGADPAPEIMADSIRARGVFDVLEGTPIWSALARAQLGLWRRSDRPADRPANREPASKSP
ncbi:protein kinase domain-containing protein [Nannocystaceae bacterium ST9]